MASIEHGVFIVRFCSIENCDKILIDIRPLLTKKPVICKPWHKDIVKGMKFNASSSYLDTIQESRVEIMGY